MVTVITVHGTFEKCEGKGWFQTRVPTKLETKDIRWFYENSEFANGVREEAGELKWITFSWGRSGKGGNNSQKIRDEAGRILYKDLKERDASGEKFILIGHSHGGNVITSAIRHAATDRNPLPNLRRAIVVGTPMLDVRPRRKIAPTGLLKRAALFLFLVVIAGAYRDNVLSSVQAGSLFLAVAACVLLSTYAYNTWFMPKYAADFFRHFEVGMSDEQRLAVIAGNRRLESIEKAYDSLGRRWYGFFHTADEALRQLQNMLNLKISVGPEAPGEANYIARMVAHLLTVISSLIMIALFVLDTSGTKFGGVQPLREVFTDLMEAFVTPENSVGEALAFASVSAFLMLAFVASVYVVARIGMAIFTGRINRRLTEALHDSMLGSDGLGYRVALRPLVDLTNDDGLMQFGYYMPSEPDDDLASALREVAEEVAAFGDPSEPVSLRFKDNVFRFNLPSSGDLNVYRFASDAFDAMMQSFDLKHNRYFDSKRFQKLIGKIIRQARKTSTQEEFEASLSAEFRNIARRGHTEAHPDRRVLA